MKSRLNHSDSTPPSPSDNSEERGRRESDADGDAGAPQEVKAFVLRSTADEHPAIPQIDDDPYESPPTSARPSGQNLVGLLLVVILFSIGYFTWYTLFRFEAFGEVSGRVVQISPAWPGVVAELHVEPGSRVGKGDTLLTLTSVEIDQQLASTQDELTTARAELEAEASRVAIAAQDNFDSTRKVWSDFYLLQGDHGAASAELDEIKNRLTRYRELADSKVVTDEEIISLELELKGKQTLADRYADALDEQRLRAAAAAPVSAEKRLSPYVARIDTLTKKLQRLRDRQQNGVLKAPFDAKVIRVRKLVCEYCAENEPVVELLQEGTTEVVLYVSQSQADRFQVGQEASVLVQPYASDLECVVARLGERIDVPLGSVEHLYRPHDLTRPVHLTFQGGDLPDDLPLGAQAKLVRLGKRLNDSALEKIIGKAATGRALASRVDAETDRPGQ